MSSIAIDLSSKSPPQTWSSALSLSLRNPRHWICTNRWQYKLLEQFYSKSHLRISLQFTPEVLVKATKILLNKDKYVRRIATLEARKRLASICISSRVYPVDRISGNRILSRYKDRLKNHKEDTNRQTPSSLWKNYNCLIASYSSIRCTW